MFQIDFTAKRDSRMAIDESDFAAIKSALATLLKEQGENIIDTHAAAIAAQPKYASGQGDLYKRVRWDSFWAARRYMPEDVKRALDLMDSHIDSALRRLIVQVPA